MLMVVVDVDDLFVVGGAKDITDFHHALNNKFLTNMVGELSRYEHGAYRLHIRTKFQGRDR